MHEGDFVITPPMAWHDHGNESDRPMFWLDGLDIPVVQFLDASFAEQLNADAQPITRRDGDSSARYGANLLPVDAPRRGFSSPIFNYPYARTREALEAMRRQEEWDPCHGLKMRYANPQTGGHAMATMATFMQLLPGGFHTEPYRSTDATIFVPMEGTGHTRIGEDFTVEWGPRDVFVVPSWNKVRHTADADAVLFSFSDRPIQEALGLFREQRG
jgi:gentisate 1,2-dioxygenase